MQYYVQDPCTYTYVYRTMYSRTMFTCYLASNAIATAGPGTRCLEP
jgi:hypothetical protein